MTTDTWYIFRMQYICLENQMPAGIDAGLMHPVLILIGWFIHVIYAILANMSATEFKLLALFHLTRSSSNMATNLSRSSTTSINSL